MERYSHTTDLYRELRGLREHLSEAGSQAPTRPETPLPPARSKRKATLILALLAALVAGFVIALLAVPADVGMEDHRFKPFATEEGFESGAAGLPMARRWRIAARSTAYRRSLCVRWTPPRRCRLRVPMYPAATRSGRRMAPVSSMSR